MLLRVNFCLQVKFADIEIQRFRLEELIADLVLRECHFVLPQKIVIYSPQTHKVLAFVQQNVQVVATIIKK